MKDEKKHDGAVDESLSEQQFQSDVYLCCVVLVGLTAGRLAVRLNTD